MSLDYCTRKNFHIKIFNLTAYRTSLQIPFQGNIFPESNKRLTPSSKYLKPVLGLAEK